MKVFCETCGSEMGKVGLFRRTVRSACQSCHPRLQSADEAIKGWVNFMDQTIGKRRIEFDAENPEIKI